MLQLPDVSGRGEQKMRRGLTRRDTAGRDLGSNSGATQRADITSGHGIWSGNEDVLCKVEDGCH